MDNLNTSTNINAYNIFKKNPASSENALKPMSVVVKAAEVETPTIDLNKEEIKSLEKASETVKKIKIVESRANYEKLYPMALRVTSEQNLELKRLETLIMRNRVRDPENTERERITANTIIRALLSNFINRSDDIDFSDIDNEEDLTSKIEKIFKRKNIVQ